MDGREKSPLCGAGEPLGDDAEGAQPWEKNGCELTLGEVRRAGKSFRVFTRAVKAAPGEFDWTYTVNFARRPSKTL